MEGKTFVFFGQVGSGKGTQVKLLREYLKSKGAQPQVYIGTGEIFRKIVELPEDNFVAKAVKELLHSGRLIPDEETNKLVWKELENSNLADGQHLFFDGYPRTLNQSQEFEKMMDYYKRSDIIIIFIEISQKEALKRNLLRGRADDTEEGLRKRFEEYQNKVVPAMDYFKDKSDYTIHKINGEQAIADVHANIIKALGY